MNAALAFYHDLEARGVILEACGAGEHLKVEAPAGVVTVEDRAALAEFKPTLLKMLSRVEDADDDGRRFDARRSKHPGYTSLYDPVHDEWHDFPTEDCYPSVVALAKVGEMWGLQHDQCGRSHALGAKTRSAWSERPRNPR